MRLKHIIGYTATLAVGGIIGYKFAYKKAFDHYNDIFKEEMGVLTEHAYGGEVGNEDDFDTEETINKFTNPAAYATKPADRTDYTKFDTSGARSVTEKILNDIQKPELEDPEVVEDVSISNVFDDTLPFELMTEEEFFEDPEEDIFALAYYAKDGILADDTGIVDAVYTIGGTTLDFFGQSVNGVIPSDPNILYVKNNKINTKYEVVRVDASYAQQVVGLKDGDL